MTNSERFIKDQNITELSYNEAIEFSMNELQSMGITSRSQVYDNDELLDTPIYPMNAQLYDEFCESYGFDTQEYMLFIAKRIENL